MPDHASLTLHRRIGRLRLDTLVRLRWLAVTGQSVAVAGVHLGLGFSLPFGACFAVIAVSALLNIVSRIRYPMSHRLSNGAATLLLSYDIIQLGVLLFLTGGLINPFSILILAPVLISATTLPPWRTLVLGTLAIFCVTLLSVFYLALPWVPGQELRLPMLYVFGIWAATILGITFTAVYAWRVSEEARDLAEALAATELILAREQHLSQLDGLAAAAAHELGTPLATITLVVKEIERLAPQDGAFVEDIVLLREQVDRCREILGKLTSLGNEQVGPLERLTLSHMVEEVVGPHRPFGIDISVTGVGDGPEPECRRSPGLLYGLGNIVDNAVDFATDVVTIEKIWDQDSVTLIVMDDGPGFAPDVMLRIGEPYVTTRGGGQQHADEPARGLGLGLFIAKTLIERSGATLSLANAAPPGHGAVITITWPRAAFMRDLPAWASAPSLPSEIDGSGQGSDQGLGKDIRPADAAAHGLHG